MAEYIKLEDATAIIEEKQKELCPVGRYGRGYVYNSDREKYDAWDEIIDALENIPAADVAPVAHGHWIEKKSAVGRYFECSNCGAHENKHTAIKGRFCWGCGAKMDESMPKDGAD